MRQWCGGDTTRRPQRLMHSWRWPSKREGGNSGAGGLLLPELRGAALQATASRLGRSHSTKLRRVVLHVAKVAVGLSAASHVLVDAGLAGALLMGNESLRVDTIDLTFGGRLSGRTVWSGGQAWWGSNLSGLAALQLSLQQFGKRVSKLGVVHPLMGHEPRWL